MKRAPDHYFGRAASVCATARFSVHRYACERMATTSQDVEILRLNALAIAQAARIRELEDALARCTERGIKLSEVLRYHADHPEAR
jgi:hypothetical protein